MILVAAAGITSSLQAQQKENVEDVVNSRIIISKMDTVYDTETAGSSRNAPKTIDSIAWSPDGKKLLVDIQGVNQFFSVALLDLSGEKVALKNLTSNREPGNTRLNNSNPCFFKDGKHYVFIGQDLDSKEYRRSLPGIGLFSNVWLSKVNSPNYWKITNCVSSFKASEGAVMPRFSKDGSQICWVNCFADAQVKNFWGKRSVSLAKFTLGKDGPSLSNTRTFTPGNNKTPFYETYGFSPDGKKVLLAATLDMNQEWFGMDICAMDAETGEVKPLTDNPKVWNRYADYSPSGKKVLFTSSDGYAVPFLGFNGEQWKSEMVSELWIMSGNGTEKRKLTGFNDIGNPYYVKTRAYIGMVAWNPADPNKVAFILNVQNNAYTTASSVIVAELANSLTVNLRKK